MGKYIDPFTDVGFKIVFGKENSSNEILREFLNDLFEGEEDFGRIRTLRYLNNDRCRYRSFAGGNSGNMNIAPVR